jgi:class 3 adenylate cyclase/tetratricopeptide (TPR) repeat protein
VDQAHCPNCAQPVPEGARFCPACGTSVGPRVDAAERRVVTAIFADLAGSTRLGEQLDPEVLRDVVTQFFEVVGREIRHHGGAVEQFSGDAAVGVFGLTSSHEDDAERAVRTAFAIVKALEPLRAAAREQHKVNVDVHVGIETGEAVSGDPFAGGTAVTGDALNVAARLEKSAAPGQILVGPAAYAATKHAIEYESIGELALAGKSLPVTAHQPIRFLADIGEARGLRGLKAPLLGRDEEMLQLLDTAERVRQDRKAMLFTVLGAPGIGKSRLARDAGDRLMARRWQVLRGRCLPYGEGITYWPVGEMVRQASGITSEMGALEAIGQLVASSLEAGISDRLAFAIGLTRDSPVSGTGIDREIAWAFRRWVQTQAARSPLLLVFEDIHWAEPAMLDLIEYLATWSGEAPVFILCLARPELLDKRPGWAAGRFQASRIMLEPLNRNESAALIGALLTVEGLPDRLRNEMLERADGNPLFVEELIRMLLDEGTIIRTGNRWIAAPTVSQVRVPSTVEALIRARLDTLPRPERSALQAGSVIGRIFDRPMLDGLLDDVDRLDAALENLILRDLVSEEPLPGGRASYRFKHILVRDVAYATLPKARRAALHARVATDLASQAFDRSAELVEIRAYHLEQAVQLETELHAKPSEALRQAAVAALEASGQKAGVRGDYRAALSFFERCLQLGPEPEAYRLELECQLLDVEYRLGRWTQAKEKSIRVAAAARAIGRKDLEGRALLAQGRAIWIGDPEGGAEKALARLTEAHTLLTEAGDLAHLQEAAFQLGWGGWWYGRFEEALPRWSQAREIARQLGDRGLESRALVQLAGIRYHQGRIAEAAEMRRESVELSQTGGSRVDWGFAVMRYGWLVALTRSIDEGLRLSESSIHPIEEASENWELASALYTTARLHLLRGAPAHAVPYSERALALSKEMQETGSRPEIERGLAQALLELDDIDGAASHAEAGVQVVAADDWASVGSTTMVLGLVRARQGRSQEAESLLRKAIAVVESTDYVAENWEYYLPLAEFLLAQGRSKEAEEWIAKLRKITALYGEASPLAAYVERRLAATVS